MAQAPVNLRKVKSIWKGEIYLKSDISTIKYFPDGKASYFFRISSKEYFARLIYSNNSIVFLTSSANHCGFTCIHWKKKSQIIFSLTYSDHVPHFSFLESFDFLDMDLLKREHRCLDFKPPKRLVAHIVELAYYTVLHDLYKVATAEIMWLVIQAFQINLIEKMCKEEDIWIFELIQTLTPKLSYCQTLFPPRRIEDFESYVTCLSHEDSVVQPLSREIKELADLLAEPAIFSQLPALSLGYKSKNFFLLTGYAPETIPIFLNNIRYLIYLLYFLKEWEILEELCHHALKSKFLA